jgi:hypothetical protein
MGVSSLSLFLYMCARARARACVFHFVILIKLPTCCSMFMSSCKRLRIMKGSEARGLGCGV